MTSLGAGDRDRGPRRAQDRLEDVLRLRGRVSVRNPTPTSAPPVSGSRGPAGHQCHRYRIDHANRAGPSLRDRPAVGVSPQELLLRRPSQELSMSQFDLPICYQRLARRRASTASRAGSGSNAPTWKRTPARACTRASVGGSTRPPRPGSISTARGFRSSRSSPGQTSARPPRPGPMPRTCARSSPNSTFPTPGWRKARSASTPTCPCDRRVRRSTGPRSRSRT